MICNTMERVKSTSCSSVLRNYYAQYMHTTALCVIEGLSVKNALCDLKAEFVVVEFKLFYYEITLPKSH